MRSEEAARDMGDESRAGEPSASEVKVTVVQITYGGDLDNRQYFSHPDGVRVREKETLAFRTNGTNAKIFFPQAEMMFEEGKQAEVLEVKQGGDDITLQVKEGAARDDAYEFAIFVESAGPENKSLGQFAEGGSTPKVMIEPPGDDG